MIKHSPHKKEVNFLKKTNCDTGEKGKSTPNGIMFYSGFVLLVGKARLSDRMGKWGTPTSSFIHSAVKYFSLHQAQLLGTSNGP